MSDKKARRRSYKYFVCILLVVVLMAAVSSFGVAYARYVKQNASGQGVVTSQEMYFESDYLSEQGEKYTISGNEVTFRLMNYPDALRVSELPVNYKISVTNGATITIDDQATTGEQREGTLVADSQQTVEVKISNLQPGQTYTVTAIGENGFQKTLTATFTVQAAENGVFMSMEQTDYYVLLTVWTQNVWGDANIVIPGGLIPDNTDPVLANVQTGDEYFEDKGENKSFAAPYSSRTYRFFKQTTGTNYQLSQFDGVTVGGVEAKLGTD